MDRLDTVLHLCLTGFALFPCIGFEVQRPSCSSIMMVPRVSLRVLRRQLLTNRWEENVEALSVSLSKHHCVVLHLPASDAADVDVAVAAFQGLFSAAEQAVAPLSADTPGQTAGMSSATGSQRFEFRRGAESAAQLPSPIRIAAYEASA